jgi:ectoine hydroxylase-related dioxygenase (phytanoyl-CoA dioxygenase family)
MRGTGYNVESTPEQGPIRFLSRSHREGPLGSTASQAGAGDLLEQYPLLPEVLGVSAPEEAHFQPGDATVHHGYCAHGSANNTSARDQSAYAWSYTGADARFLEGVNGRNGSDRKQADDELAHREKQIGGSGGSLEPPGPSSSYALPHREYGVF